MNESDAHSPKTDRADRRDPEPVAIDITDETEHPATPGIESGDATAPADGAKSAADTPPCDDLPLGMRIEALLLAADRPLSTGKLGEMLGIETRGLGKRIKDEIEQLNAAYEATGRSFRIEQIAGGWQLYTIEAVGPLVARQHSHRQSNRLSQAALETLSIIAYRQPILRAEIEAIRGVASGEVLRGLLERRLVAIVGRAEELGRPMLYGTTRFFLEVFGLNDLEDLPPVEGLTPGGGRASGKKRSVGDASEKGSAAMSAVDDGSDDGADATGETAGDNDSREDTTPTDTSAASEDAEPDVDQREDADKL